MGPRKPPHTLIALNNLAGVLQQGHVLEAEALHRLTLAARQNSLGVELPDTLYSLVNLAYVLHQQGRLSERGKRICTGVLLRSESACWAPTTAHTLLALQLGKHAPRPGKIGGSRGDSPASHGRPGEGVWPRSPGHALFAGSVALLLQDQGKREEAEAMGRETLAAMERVFGT